MSFCCAREFPDGRRFTRWEPLKAQGMGSTAPPGTFGRPCTDCTQLAEHSTGNECTSNQAQEFEELARRRTSSDLVPLAGKRLRPSGRSWIDGRRLSCLISCTAAVAIADTGPRPSSKASYLPLEKMAGEGQLPRPPPTESRNDIRLSRQSLKPVSRDTTDHP